MVPTCLALSAAGDENSGGAGCRPTAHHIPRAGMYYWRVRIHHSAFIQVSLTSRQTNILYLINHYYMGINIIRVCCCSVHGSMGCEMKALHYRERKIRRNMLKSNRMQGQVRCCQIWSRRRKRERRITWLDPNFYAACINFLLNYIQLHLSLFKSFFFYSYPFLVQLFGLRR